MMNRRDYLIRMGAVASTLAAGKLDIFADSAQQRTRRRSGDQRSKIFVESGPRQFDLLSTESVKLVFTGLMALSRNQAGECVVDFYSKESNQHKHHLMINIYKKQGNSCQPPEEIRVEGQTLSLVVIDPELLNGVHFFQPPLMADGSKHDNDFRYMPNLEGPEWYQQPLTRKAGFYSPTLVVPHGLFYTLRKTSSTFRRQKPEGDDVLEVKNIADYVGANIYLKPGGKVELNIGGTVKVLQQATNVKYEIHFVNHCKDKATGNDCEKEFKPYHLTDKTKRNDFYMNFEALEGLSPESEYHLIIEKKGTPKRPDICRTVARATDEAPCSAVGFGGTDGGGFPQFP
jgi:hypothetical protein